MQKPFLSIIIPVLNEGNTIRACLEALQSQRDGARVEIVLVDGEANGSTVRVVDDLRGVRTVVSAPGRALQMNRGAQEASSDVLLFLHADTVLPQDAIHAVEAALMDPAIVGGAFGLGFASPQKVYRITERYVSLRNRITKVPFGDQALFFRAQYFRELGGFRNMPIMEDVELMRRIKKRGDRIVLLPQRVMTSTRRYDEEGIVRCTVRNLTLQMLYICGVSGERLAGLYRSRGIDR
jgi:rSAM/selenodomain-associated transferase 2